MRLFSSEINSVLAVLDEEKDRIKERIGKLKRTNEYYRSIYEGTSRPKVTEEVSANTEPVPIESTEVQTDP